MAVLHRFYCSIKKLSFYFRIFRLDGVAAIDVVRLILPDVAVFVTGLLVYIICFKLLPQDNAQSEELPKTVRSRRKRTLNDVLQFFGETLVVFLLAASGIIVPGVLSAVYFVSFIFIATVWSLYGRLGRKFSCFRILILIYSALHLLALHLYQFQFFQEALAPEAFISRFVHWYSKAKKNIELFLRPFF